MKAKEPDRGRSESVAPEDKPASPANDVLSTSFLETAQQAPNARAEVKRYTLSVDERGKPVLGPPTPRSGSTSTNSCEELKRYTLSVDERGKPVFGPSTPRSASASTDSETSQSTASPIAKWEVRPVRINAQAALARRLSTTSSVTSSTALKTTRRSTQDVDSLFVKPFSTSGIPKREPLDEVPDSDQSVVT